MFESFEQMIADPKLDGVIICLPNFLHFPATLATLEAGKHVLCEKPPTLNLLEMKRLHEETQRRKHVYFFGRQLRFSDSALAVKRLIEQDRLGAIYFAKAIWVRSRGTPSGVGGWFTDRARAGGGALIDIGIHALDAVWHLMGTPRPLTVSGRTFSNFARLSTAEVFDVDDAAYGLVRFDNGAVVQFEISWAANLPDDIPLDPYNGRELVNSVLYGPKATIRLNPLTLFEDQDGQVQTVQIAPIEGVLPFHLQMEKFIDAILGLAAPENDSRQALQLMQMIDAIYESSRTGREVIIEAIA